MSGRPARCARSAACLRPALACAARLLAALAALPVLMHGAQAAPDNGYPARPVRLIVPFSPGGVSDTLARLIAEHMERAHGQPFVVENRPGASGNIAADLVAKAPPDGHTLLVAGNNITILPSTHGADAVDPVRAYAPVARLVTQPILIAANPALPARTLPDLVAAARAAPGKFAYASAGVGTTDHLAAALLWSRAGADMLHVPYANTNQEVKDLLQGEVPVAFITIAAVAPHLQSGRLRAMAVTGERRVAAFPEVPTVAESGYPGFAVTSWYGVLAPAGTPQPIVDQLQREIAAIMALPSVREKCAAIGVEPAVNAPDAFAQEIRRLVAYWRPVVEAAGIAGK